MPPLLLFAALVEGLFFQLKQPRPERSLIFRRESPVSADKIPIVVVEVSVVVRDDDRCVLRALDHGGTVSGA